MLPKPYRDTSREYLDLVKMEPCLVGMDCNGQVDPAHIRPISTGGSDFQVVPLCRKHHSMQHQMGWSDFCLEVSEKPFEYSLSLLLKYCNVTVKEEFLE